MLKIKLNKGSSSSAETGGGAKPLPADTVTAACPDHLVLADLPVAKSLGAPPAALLVKTVGRKARRSAGERVHFCVKCDFPIFIYGRLSPCSHAFCLDCAKSDSVCYLCDVKIQKIHTIKMMEGGIFICAAPHCLISFLSKSEFQAHLQANHADLLPNTNSKAKEEGDELEDINVKPQLALPPKLPFPPTGSSSSQINDQERFLRPPMMPQQPPRPPMPFLGQQTANNYPPNFPMPGNPNQIPPYGVQPFYGGPPPFPYPLLGFRPDANIHENYPRPPWNMGQPIPPPPTFDPSSANMVPPPPPPPPFDPSSANMVPPPPPPPLQPPMYPNAEMGNDSAQGFGWQYDKRN